MTYSAAAAWQTDIGPRNIMQDNVLVGSGEGAVPFVVVADGVGSVPGSEIAALLAVDTFASAAKMVNETGDIADAMLTIVDNVAARLSSEGSRVGSTTLAGAVVDESGRLWITNVGDSTVAVFTESGLVLSTRPHNQAEDARVSGSTDPEELAATHVLTRAVRATTRPIGADVTLMRIREPTVVVAATDGVTGKLSLQEIYREVFPVDSAVAPTLSDAQCWSEECARRIMHSARGRRLDDNAAVAVMAILPFERGE